MVTIWGGGVCKSSDTLPVTKGRASPLPNYEGSSYLCHTAFDENDQISCGNKDGKGSCFTGVSHAIACCANASRSLSAIGA